MPGPSGASCQFVAQQLKFMRVDEKKARIGEGGEVVQV